MSSPPVAGQSSLQSRLPGASQKAAQMLQHMAVLYIHTHCFQNTKINDIFHVGLKKIDDRKMSERTKEEF